MVKVGVISSRMKDFYDIWLLSNHFDFSGTILSEAISKTFNKRRTELPSNIDEFIRGLKSDPAKDRQWKGFIRKNKLEDAPSTLDDVLDAILSFLSSPVKKLTEGQAWKSEWKKSGPWTE